VNSAAAPIASRLARDGRLFHRSQPRRGGSRRRRLSTNGRHAAGSIPVRLPFGYLPLADSAMSGSDGCRARGGGERLGWVFISPAPRRLARRVTVGSRRARPTPRGRHAACPSCTGAANRTFVARALRAQNCLPRLWARSCRYAVRRRPGCIPARRDSAVGRGSRQPDALRSTFRNSRT
jgi:hypothetical protein